MIIVALVFILLGVLVKYGKMYFLIAGYNTMSKEEKATINIAGVANIFRNAMFGMALLNILGYLIAYYTNESKVAIYFLFGSIVLGIPYLLVKSNSKKFKNNNSE